MARPANDDQTAGALIRALAHPYRPRILEMAAGERLSTTAIAERLGVPLPNASYHVRELKIAGLLKLAGKRTGPSGVVQRFYVVDEDARLAAVHVLRETADKIERGSNRDEGG